MKEKHKRGQSLVNDVHSELNETLVSKLVMINKIEDISSAIKQAKQKNMSVAVCGGRHAMGGQQFATNGYLLDMKNYNRIQHFDNEKGQITFDAGIQWPELIRGYHLIQKESGIKWGIAQKQTGADRLSIGGAIAANIHGRGLNMAPFCQDIVSFSLVDADGDIHFCSPKKNTALFRRVIGGYGLFGIVASVTIQLVERTQVERVVKELELADLINQFELCQQQGYLYGDFQFAIDANSDDFLHQGIFSGYKPVKPVAVIPKSEHRLSKQNWQELLLLAHTDKTRAFEVFKKFYLNSSGQRYWSDTHQLSIYLDDYHKQLDIDMGSVCKGSEMITELYVPKTYLIEFMTRARTDLKRLKADIIYGTIRIIRQDKISAMPWATEDFACIIFNLHTDHTEPGIKKSKEILRLLIDIAITYQGSYFPTYHRYATKRQVLACYPDFIDILRAKKLYDPHQVFQSDWYRHYSNMFSQELHKSNKNEHITEQDISK